jgi:adenosylcobinamide kinase/adenosylcobinamide-phosphate guanylyltransferase
MTCVISVIGGARSGKSSFALKHAGELPGSRLFIATAEASDDDMAARIEKHKSERGSEFSTLEIPIDLGKKIAELKKDSLVKTILVDCLTVWLGNLFHHFEGKPATIQEKIKDLIDAVSADQSCDTNIILVANEVGFGIVPETSLGRDFRDMAGWLNQSVSARANKVYICVAGIPMKIKG